MKCMYSPQSSNFMFIKKTILDLSAKTNWSYHDGDSQPPILFQTHSPLTKGRPSPFEKGCFSGAKHEYNASFSMHSPVLQLCVLGEKGIPTSSSSY